MAELEKAGAPDIPVVMGGIIPDADIPELEAIGVKAVFTPGPTPLGTIVGRIIEIAGA